MNDPQSFGPYMDVNLNQAIIEFLRRGAHATHISKPYNQSAQDLDQQTQRMFLTPQQLQQQLAPPQSSPPYLMPWDRYNPLHPNVPSLESDQG